MGRVEVIKADIAELRQEKVAALRRVEAALQDEIRAQVCTATVTYSNGDTIHCDDHQGGRLHSNAAYGVVWSG